MHPVCGGCRGEQPQSENTPSTLLPRGSKCASRISFSDTAGLIKNFLMQTSKCAWSFVVILNERKHRLTGQREDMSAAKKNSAAHIGLFRRMPGHREQHVCHFGNETKKQNH